MEATQSSVWVVDVLVLGVVSKGNDLRVIIAIGGPSVAESCLLFAAGTLRRGTWRFPAGVVDVWTLWWAAVLSADSRDEKSLKVWGRGGEGRPFCESRDGTTVLVECVRVCSEGRCGSVVEVECGC